MARRSGSSHKGVEEKRRSLPIYEHYTLSPGKTKSHHPEAKCNHCQKEFVCGSKQRLIRHLRKCTHISNPDQIIAETLNTLARNSATGQLNHSILEASNLLPSRIQHHHPHLNHHHHHQNHSQQQILGQLTHSSPASTLTTANSNNTTSANNNNINNNNIITNHNTSGSSSGDALGGVASNGSAPSQQLINAMSIPVKRPLKRGRKPASQSLAASSPSIHVTTGLDGKTHFTPTSQLPPNVAGSPLMAAPVHAIGGQTAYAYPGTSVVATSTGLNVVGPNPLGSSVAAPSHPISGHHHHHLTPTANHHSTSVGYKFNSDPSDKAYLKLVLTRNLPLSLCDTREFQLWVKTFANDYKPPTSINLIAQNLKNEAQTAKQRISNILVKAFKKTINLELHSWPDEHDDGASHPSSSGHLWYAVIANIDHKRFLVSLKDVRQPTGVSPPSPSTSNSNSNNNTANQQASPNEVVATTDQLLSDFIDGCVKKIGSDRINCLVFSDEDPQLKTKVSQILYTTHPSIITYQCWWHFTNLLCSDIIEQNLLFQDVIRKSNRVIDFVTKRPSLSQTLEKFNPFIGVGSNVIVKKNDQRWYSHLVCYLLEYLKNNNEAIIRALQAVEVSSSSSSATSNHQSQETPSDNNNNNSSGTQQAGTQLQDHQILSSRQDSKLNSLKAIVTSNDFWNNLSSALTYLKPIHDIVALTSSISVSGSSNGASGTPQAAPTVASSIYLSQYMSWFLSYGKTLFDSWRHGADNYKYQLIKQFMDRFADSLQNFKLLLAAYLLDPKHRCAYMTQQAKDMAIEEILNIASEFIPEESDGHTIFDQWKLYLVRDEPYDVVYDESRTSPLEWWQSLPCAESIRRVALRILRLKAFASPKPTTLFSQLYFYENETNSNLNDSTFEDVAVLRYFYDFEDKIGQTSNNYHNSASSSLAANNSSSHHGSSSSSSHQDRAQVGLLHSNLSHQLNNSLKYLPAGPIPYSSGSTGSTNNNSASESISGQSLNDSTTSTSSMAIGVVPDNGAGHVESFANDSASFSDVVVVESYLGENGQPESHYHHMTNNQQLGACEKSNLSIEDLPSYKLFTLYVDYNIMGVQPSEEPTEKKRRKWTAQEILSKCQSNHNNNNNNNNSIKNC